MGDRKDPKLNERHNEILRQLLQRPENKHCADCETQAPRWASTNLGVFICIRCSGLHRNLGVHISTVRSTTLDTWTPKQIEEIQRKGNNYGKQMYEACVPANFRRPDTNDTAQIERWIRDKYEKKLFMRKEDGGRGGEATSRDRRQVSLGPRSMVGGGENSDVRKMVEMGFDHAESAAALARCGGDVSSAIEMLLSNPRHKTHGPSVRVPYPKVNQKRLHPTQPPEPKPAEVNLIDFGFEDSKPHAEPASVQTQFSSQPKNNVTDDFADFSAFESASSLSTSEPTANQATTGGKDLMDTITSLYRNAPTHTSGPAATTQVLQSIPKQLAQNEAAEDNWWSSSGPDPSATGASNTNALPPPAPTKSAASGKDVFDDLFGSGRAGGFDSLFNNTTAKKN
eukprot:Plantae.Rhodophyta-Purpureofilum_apyrenoidigerum.ctg11666.p1 GENE.Plantae.Rhodophyta-Purpureofilum_apyrenoidigerum.ctg11666~~Plantae.Rhodophyta-Purpureofilum_apyrenoidigerum.ctg11666.p1  ORF type:complete len:397 (-),score=56.71 Plantae.Rhodophyta-Purpureofilum_apyrenoidigerum.ctg11666:1281-2471(-)